MNWQTSLTDLGYGITEWGVDDFTGNVYIGVLSEDIADVNALIDGQQPYTLGRSAPAVMIEEGRYITLASNVQPGASLGNITLGAYGYYNGDKAIVTCGHGGHSVDDPFSFGNVSGYYEVRQCEHQQAGDYAIGILDGNPTMRHAFGTTGEAITGVAYSPVCGSYIRKYGKVAGIMDGKVFKLNADFHILTGTSNPLTITATGLTKVQVTSGSAAFGDSGGPCVTYTNGFCGVFNGFDLREGSTSEIEFFYFTTNSTLYAAGFRVFTQHVVSSWSTYDADWHYGYCSACSSIAREGHGAYWDETTIPYCTRCGYTA